MKRLFFVLLMVSSIFSIEVILYWPPDLAQTLNQNVSFKFKAIDSSLTNFVCSLQIDGTTYSTLYNVPNDTVTTIYPDSPIPYGEHLWRIVCSGETPPYGYSENRTIGIGQNFSRCAVLIDSNVTYYLNGSVNGSSYFGCINITANNTVLDCQGNEIYGALDNGKAFMGIFSSQNASVKNCILNSSNLAGSGLYIRDSEVYLYNFIVKNASNGLDVGNSSISIRDSVIEEVGNGISASSDGKLVFDIYNLSVSNSTSAVRLEGSFSPFSGNITDSRFLNCSDVCLYILNSLYTSNIRIENNVIRAEDRGIYLKSEGIEILNNTIYSGNYGIIIEENSNIIANNTFYDTAIPISFSYDSMALEDCMNTVENNTLDGLQILYYFNGSGISVSNSDIGEVVFCYLNDSSVINANVKHIFVAFSNNVTIEDSDVNNKVFAIVFKEPGKIMVVGTNVSSENYGIVFFGLSSDGIIKNSVIETGNYPLILLNTIYNLTIYNNIINSSKDPYFSFVGNLSLNVSKTSGTNIVGGPYMGGNYWVGFSDTCTDADKDGICDQYYNISGYVDWLPLTNWAPSGVSPVLDNFIRSTFSLNPPYSLNFWVSFQEPFYFGFDYGGRNISLYVHNNLLNITVGGTFVGSYPIYVSRGDVSVSCGDKIILSFLGRDIVINENCTGGKIEFGCSSCKIGPLGIVGEIS